jgi:hypothetical protein
VSQKTWWQLQTAVSLRLTKQEKERAQQRALDDGTNLSAWIRLLILERINSPTMEPAE